MMAACLLQLQFITCPKLSQRGLHIKISCLLLWFSPVAALTRVSGGAATHERPQCTCLAASNAVASDRHGETHISSGQVQEQPQVQCMGLQLRAQCLA
jgi:hypothetical protein